MDYLKTSRFGISEDYDEDMAYKITVVRYAMSENSYQKYIATTIASDVSEESVAYVSENTAKLQGVDARIERGVGALGRLGRERAGDRKSVV